MPASFDEEARELTVMAAEQAGSVPKLMLLEEPAARAGTRAIVGLEHG